MDRQHYKRLKNVLAEKENTGTWLSEQEPYEIARHLDVDVKELLVSS